MIGKAIETMTAEDINALVENEVTESATLDYKETLPGQSDDDKKEFLADVSSFANTRGGDLVCGIRERRDANRKPTGIPDEAVGLSVANSDAELRRMESILLTALAPRLSGVQFRFIDGFPQGPALVIRIPKSWASPHMVTFKNSSRFFARNATGKYQLDVGQIRSAFLLSHGFAERLRDFRVERVAKVIADETPVPLTAAHRTILHLVPFSAMDPAYRLDISRAAAKRAEQGVIALQPLSVRGWDHRFNLDGFVTFGGGGRDAATVRSYVQFFRHGALEATCDRYAGHDPQSKVGYVYTKSIEEDVIQAVERWRELLREWNVDGPYVVMLTLVGMRGFRLSVATQSFFGMPQYPLDRDVVSIPEVIIDASDVPADVVLRPMFDALWQAGGLNSCLDYDSDGRWNPPDR
jgi:hypothetical protein